MPHSPNNAVQCEPKTGPALAAAVVTCDSCLTDIRKTRYKCTSCPNYDLCSGCYERALGRHAPQLVGTKMEPRGRGRHLFLRIDDDEGHGFGIADANRADTSNLSNFVHGEAACVGCGLDRIVGFRYSCIVCPGVHLCEGCERTGMFHDAMHPRVKILGWDGRGETNRHNAQTVKEQRQQQPAEAPSEQKKQGFPLSSGIFKVLWVESSAHSVTRLPKESVSNPTSKVSSFFGPAKNTESKSPWTKAVETIPAAPASPSLSKQASVSTPKPPPFNSSSFFVPSSTKQSILGTSTPTPTTNSNPFATLPSSTFIKQGNPFSTFAPASRTYTSKTSPFTFAAPDVRFSQGNSTSQQGHSTQTDNPACAISSKTKPFQPQYAFGNSKTLLL